MHNMRIDRRTEHSEVPYEVGLVGENSKLVC